jgi:vacuolar-type H+-ATPase subunit F/Vma7
VLLQMLCFNLFIAVISYSFGQIQEHAHSEDDSEQEEEEDDGGESVPPSSSSSLLSSSECAASKADAASSDDLEGKDDGAGDLAKMKAPDDAADKESSSEPGAGKGAGGVYKRWRGIKAGFTNAQRQKLRTQGVSAFMSSDEAVAEEQPLTSGQKQQLKKATAAQDDIRRCTDSCCEIVVVTHVLCRALAEANERIKQSRETTVVIVDEQQKKQREEQQEIEPEGPCKAQCREWQEKVRWLVTTDRFDQLIMAAIVLNTICLAVVHYNQPELMTDVLNWLEYGFTAVFLLEAAVKLYGLGLTEYFSSGSNVFDFVITLLSFVSLFDMGAGNFSALRTLRVFRALRIARILRRFPVVMR